MQSVDESLFAVLRAVTVMIFADGYMDTKQHEDELIEHVNRLQIWQSLEEFGRQIGKSDIQKDKIPRFRGNLLY